jgi:hypothetical protein
MVLGSGPIAILSVNSNAPHQAIHPGERIGQYKLVEVTTEGVQLEWNGQLFTKTAEELSERAKAAPEPPAGQPARTANAAPAAPAAPPPPPGPGQETAYGIRVCNINDGVAEGTVMDGYRKVIYSSPFGKSCGWERVR